MLGTLFSQLLRSRSPRETRSYHEPAYLGEQLTAKAKLLRGSGFLDYPALVHVETRAVCNAACSFCPYDQLERKGMEMPDALIEKIIDELTEIPPDVSFQFAPYKVSDPLLEPRLFDILARVNERLPNASVSIITNGSALTQAKIDSLGRVQNLRYINVSLNYVEPGEYEQVMKLPLVHTLERMRLLEKAVAEQTIRCPVRVTRVGQGHGSDRHFRAWVKANFPSFQSEILPRNDWIGQVEAGPERIEVPDIPCHRWFDLSVTATGVVAMCCMDGEARYPKGDVRTQHILEIYNQPHLRALRQSLPSRRQAGTPCAGCTYLSY